MPQPLLCQLEKRCLSVTFLVFDLDLVDAEFAYTPEQNRRNVSFNPFEEISIRTESEGVFLDFIHQVDYPLTAPVDDPFLLVVEACPHFTFAFS